MQLNDLLTRAEQCHQQTALEYFNALSGQKDQLNFVEILNRYPELHSKATYDQVAGLTAADVPDERERRFLKEWITGNYFTERVKELAEELENAEGDAVVGVEGQALPYRAVPVVIGNEADYDKRGRLDEGYMRAMGSLNARREQVDATSREVVTELGYASMIDMCEKLSQMKIYPLREQLSRFLDETDALYAERREYWAAQTPGLAGHTMRHCDIAFLMRAGRFDGLFPREGAVPALARTLAGLGIDLERQGNVTLDLEERPKKTPRAFCIGIDVPRDVRLVLSPHGGQDDYTTLFHEAGHLEFGAHMGAGLSFLYRNHGDTSVHESYAFLLQHLVDSPAWWREVMKADPGEFPRFAKFNRLYFLRRYGSKLRYEVEYYERGGGPALAEAYVRELSRGTGVAYPAERYLADFDGGFYVLQYLQAWIWEAMLRRHLEREYGETWFTKRSAGDFLRELWQDGQKYDVWEIAGKLGYDGLDISVIREELTA
jgi:hypothetical protein